MTDTWNVTGAYDKTTYNQGDTMKVTITGNDVLTQTSQQQLGVLTLTLLAADGATTTISVPASVVNVTTSTPQSVKITSVTDTSGRTWGVDASGLFAIATA